MFYYSDLTILSKRELKSPTSISSYCPNSVGSLHISYKYEHKKGQFEPAGVGKLIEKQFSCVLCILVNTVNIEQ
jgi:hypothetical protein